MARTENKQLTEEIIFSVSRRTVLKNIFGPLAIFIAINIFAIWYLVHYTPNLGYKLIKIKWALLDKLKTPAGLLIIGDSSGNQGVDPEIMKEKTGLDAINLCTMGGSGAVDDAYMLEAHIKRLGPPKAALVIHGYDVWSRDVEIPALAQIPEDISQYQMDLNFSLKQKIRFFVNRYVPLYSQVSSLSEIIKNPALIFNSGEVPINDKGFMKRVGADPAYLAKDLAAHQEFLAEQQNVFADANYRALKEMTELADEYDFDLFVANGPVYEKLFEDEKFRNFFSSLQLKIYELVRKSPHTYYINADPMPFPAAQLESVDHVTYEGAIRYSEHIAAAIDSVWAVSDTAGTR